MDDGAIDRFERGDDLVVGEPAQDQSAANRDHPIVLFAVDGLAEILGGDLTRILSPGFADQRQNLLM